jgi:hypothetical protein
LALLVESFDPQEADAILKDAQAAGNNTIAWEEVEN